MTISRILRAKMSVDSPRGSGALPRYLRITPHQCRPLKRAPCTPPKLYGCEVGCFAFWQIRLPPPVAHRCTARSTESKTELSQSQKGKTAILCVIGKPAQIGMLFSIGGQSVFEIGVVGVHRYPSACFIEEYLCCFLRLF